MPDTTQPPSWPAIVLWVLFDFQRLAERLIWDGGIPQTFI